MLAVKSTASYIYSKVKSTARYIYSEVHNVFFVMRIGLALEEVLCSGVYLALVDVSLK